ncbi:NAD(P)/FAD-dependent oxidoreductase [Lysinibacter cavernae]|uniref:Thioredoxin reductase n=1 Tax=Lysinibacter cavernae TaxID=1640652 RepID=A0A7X5TTB6_9MICO|nr:NAD(P)/FAD-dependent oxidoreductase [Lysinibacter cavernae]NIH53108.1 thioredoxin reductase [Lysinibacter cavernae]
MMTTSDPTAASNAATHAASADVIVVGGGPAGLSAAIALGRSRRSVIVVDAGQPRNARAHGAHNFLTRDGESPLRILELGRDEAARYGVTIVNGAVSGVAGSVGSFTVATEAGDTYVGRRIIIASGIVDSLPDIAGLAERWGIDAIHCPYCHGWEVRDKTIAVIATSPLSMHQATLFRQWTEHLILLENEQFVPMGEDALALEARGTRRVAGKVASLRVEQDALTGVVMEDGSVVPVDAVVVASQSVADSAAIRDLGIPLAINPMGTFIETELGGRTSIPGVWAAGNVTDLGAQVVTSAGAGLMAGAHVNMDLIQEETREAIARIAQ